MLEATGIVAARDLHSDFHFATHMAIYADTMALVSFHDASAILLKGKEMRNSMREFFQFVWDRAGGEVTNR